MRQYGVIGFPLEHSFSPSYFKKKFEKENIHNVKYQSFPLENIHQFADLINNHSNIYGLNVTQPYKTAIIPYLDEVDDTAMEIGAVNTIKIQDNKLYGFNTDHIGFQKSLTNIESHKYALILGTGGAAKAIAFALHKLGIGFFFVSRKSQSVNTIRYRNLNQEIILKHTLIINTTPLGMYPKNEESPNIPYSFLTKDHYLYDLIYNPELTCFLKKGKESKSTIQNGLAMLHLQAEESWKIWNL